MGGFKPKYFKTETFAQLKIPTTENTICAFSQESSILIAVTKTGKYYAAEIP